MPLAQALREVTEMSANQIKRLAQQGGVSINGRKIQDTEQRAKDITKPGDTIRLGKRIFLKVKELTV